MATRRPVDAAGASAAMDFSSASDGELVRTLETIPEHKGWLHKEGGNWKTWKSRYCLLRDNLLTYYEEETSNDDKAKGIVYLDGCSINKVYDEKYEKKNCFEIAHPDRRLFVFQAANEDDLDAWVDMLHESIERYPKIKVFAERFAKVKIELESTKTTLQDLQKQRNELQEEIEGLEKKFQANQEEMATIQHEITSIQNAISSGKKEIGNLMAEKENLTSRIKAVKEDLHNARYATDHFVSVSDTKEDLIAKNKLLREKLRELQRKKIADDAKSEDSKSTSRKPGVVSAARPKAPPSDREASPVADDTDDKDLRVQKPGCCSVL